MGWKEEGCVLCFVLFRFKSKRKDSITVNTDRDFGLSGGLVRFLGVMSFFL